VRPDRLLADVEPELAEVGPVEVDVTVADFAASPQTSQ